MSMRAFLIGGLLASTAFGGFTAHAYAENDSFVTIHNNMSRAMISFQAPHIADNDGVEGDWGNNLLAQAIQPGDSRTLKIAVGDGYNWCRFHFHADFKGGMSVDNRDFNACERADWWADDRIKINE